MAKAWLLKPSVFQHAIGGFGELVNTYVLFIVDWNIAVNCSWRHKLKLHMIDLLWIVARAKQAVTKVKT